jgi:hypothetical protein
MQISLLKDSESAEQNCIRVSAGVGGGLELT